jgi:Icc-related predicted phosphoesterase
VVEMPLILATGDIHAPVYAEPFIKSLAKISVKPDLVLLAGDLVEHNNVKAFNKVYTVLLEKFGSTPLIAVFGNEEYIGFEDEYRRMYPGIKWLNDEIHEITAGGRRVCIVGSRGALNKPTRWQERNLPGLKDYYRRLPGKLVELASECKRLGSEIIVLLTHYGVTFKNLAGEPAGIWDYLALPELEKILVEGGFNVSIHAHAHRGFYEKVMVGSVPVYNVSFPARGKPVEINVG